MVINKNQLFTELLSNFLEINSTIEAIIVSDEEGFVIAGEKKKDIDIEIVSFLTAVVSPILERIRNEFAFKKFGTASFDTDENRLLFISVDASTTLSLVLESMGSIDKLAPYAYFLAEKTAQILTAVEGDLIQLSIPNFEYNAKLSESSDRLKNQIYQSKLDHGGIYRFKFIIIGDHEVGKTSIIRRFVEHKFLADYRATIGLNILSHNFEAFGNKISVFLWDIGAQQYFQRYRKTYYDGAQAAFIVFDLTSQETFKNVNIWHDELKDFIEDKDLPIIIVGNKTDLTEQRVVSYEDGMKLASDLSSLAEFIDSSNSSDFSDLSNLSNSSEMGNSRISYIETSAQTGEHVEDAFRLISYHYVIKSKEMEEKRLRDKILADINSILNYKDSLTLSFITEDPLWCPGLQLITEIRKIGPSTRVKDKKKEKKIEYQDGLILKNYIYESFKISDSDGVFCIFDARNKEHINPEWKEYIIKIIEKIKKNKVVLIGIRVSETIDWSQLMNEFDVDEQAENKMVSLLFFKIGEEYRMEIFEQLDIMVNTIKNLLFNY
ncbi:MAG: GTP-binding protein [Promethearchaeota archaeon]